jgi:hypothetical protein
MSLVFSSPRRPSPLALPRKTHVSYCYSIASSNHVQAQTLPLSISRFNCLVLLDDGGGVEGVLLSELGLDLLNEGPQVGKVLLLKKTYVSAGRSVAVLKGVVVTSSGLVQSALGRSLCW